MPKYFATYSGHMIDFNDISYEDIKLEDIVHHLCNINRFGGSLPYGTTYSVAQHSIALCSYIYDLTDDANLALHALFHDASEAYLGDVVSALKDQLSDYKREEEYIQTIIYQKFNIAITEEGSKVIAYYDKKIMMDEVKALIPEKYELYLSENNEPLDVPIVTNIPQQLVENKFMWWYKDLNKMKQL